MVPKTRVYGWALAKAKTEAELRTRVDLAACYRLVDLFGWSDLIKTRITARIPGQHPVGSGSARGLGPKNDTGKGQ